MAKDNLLYNSFRLNVKNPRHVKIHNVLKNLNPSYKSKNQFLVEAVEYYIDHIGEEDLTIKKNKKVSPEHDYVTKEELEVMKQDICNQAMTEARNEVIRLLGGMVAGMHTMNPGYGMMPANSYTTEPKNEEPEDVVMQELAQAWAD